MIRRAILFTDGTSDRPLAAHLEAMCIEPWRAINVTAPEFERLPEPRACASATASSSSCGESDNRTCCSCIATPRRMARRLGWMKIEHAVQQVAEGSRQCL